MSSARNDQDLKMLSAELFDVLAQLHNVQQSFAYSESAFFFKGREEVGLFSKMLEQWVIGLSEMKKGLPFDSLPPKRQAELVKYLEELKRHLEIVIFLFSPLSDMIMANIEKDNIVRDVAVLRVKGRSKREITWSDFLLQLKTCAENIEKIIHAENLQGLTTETKRIQALNQASYKLRLSVKHSPIDRLKQLPPEIMARVATHVPSESLANLASTSKHFTSLFDQKTDKRNNFWLYKLYQLGVQRSVLDLFEHLYQISDLPKNYRQLAINLERVMRCVENGFIVLDWRDPTVQLETLVICSHQPIMLDLNIVRQNAIEQPRHIVTAIAAGAFNMLCIEDEFLDGYYSTFSFQKEQLEDMANRLGSLLQLLNYISSTASGKAYHVLEKKQSDIDHRIVFKWVAAKELVTEVRECDFRVEKAYRHKCIAQFDFLRNNPNDTFVLLGLLSKYISRLHNLLGPEAFSRLDKLYDQSFISEYVATLNKLYDQQNVSEFERFEAILALARTKLAIPDQPHDVAYRFLFHDLPDDHPFISMYANRVSVSDNHFTVELKDPVAVTARLHDSLKNPLVRLIIASTVDDKQMEQLFNYFDLLPYIKQHFQDLEPHLLESLLECKVKSCHIIRKMLYLAQLNAESEQKIDIQKLFLSVLGGYRVARNGLPFDKIKRHDPSHHLSLWRISRADIAKMDAIVKDWSSDVLVEFFVRLGIEHCYTAAAYFIKRRLAQKQLTSTEFNQIFMIKLSNAENNPLLLLSIYQLMTEVILVCGELYQPDEQVVELLWERDPAGLVSFATYDPHLLALLLLKSNEAVRSEIIARWEKIDQFHQAPVLAYSYHLSQMNVAMPKLRTLHTLALGVRALLTDDFKSVKEHLDAAYAHQPEFFLQQIRLLLEKPSLYGFSSQQKNFLYEHMNKLFLGIQGNPDNSLLFECLIEVIAEKTNKIKPERSANDLPAPK